MRHAKARGWAGRLVLAAALLLAFAGTASAAQISGSFSNPNAIAIADGTGGAAPYTPGAGSPYPSTIAVSGLTGPTLRVRVTLSRLSHTNPDDLDILVQAPNGKRVMLLSDAGENFAVNDYTVTFDEDAASPPDTAQLTASSYATKNYFGGQGEPPDGNDALVSPAPGAPRELNLNAFNGSDPNGTWKLWVADDRPGDTGQIAGGWSLAVETEGAADITAAAGQPFTGLVARALLRRTVRRRSREPRPHRWPAPVLPPRV
jgi:subtilisin-like proprotein convertase family protein